MKIERKTSRLVLILLCIVASLSLAIFVGTVYAFVRRVFSNAKPQEEEQILSDEPQEEGQVSSEELQERSFLNIGRLRTELSPEIGSQEVVPLIVKASIPYSSADIQLQEELVRKLPEIRDVVRTFFSLYTLSEIQGMTESELKKMLLERINSLIVLEDISEIYFEEFIFFE